MRDVTLVTLADMQAVYVDGRFVYEDESGLSGVAELLEALNISYDEKDMDEEVYSEFPLTLEEIEENFESDD